VFEVVLLLMMDPQVVCSNSCAGTNWHARCILHSMAESSDMLGVFAWMLAWQCIMRTDAK
jgi:hypothetical protein